MAFIYDLTDTWSAGGTTFNAIKMNVTDTASAAASRLLTLQVGGAERFAVDKAGNVLIGNGGDLLISSATGGNNSSIYNDAQDLYIATNGASRMYVSSSGNVGIGNVSPGTRLDVTGNIRLSAAAPTIEWNTGGAQIYAPAANTIAIATGGGIGSPVERFRVDSAGRFLIGTATGVGSDFTSIRWNSGGSYPQGLNMVDSNASASGTNFQVFRKSDDTYIGNIRRSGTDNAILVNGNSYLALGSGDTERARIDSSGNVGIGTSTPSSYGRLTSDTTGLALPAIYARSADQAGARVVISNTGTGGQTWQLVAGDVGVSNSGLSFYDGTATRMRIDSSGNVGIGLTSLSSGYGGGGPALNIKNGGSVLWPNASGTWNSTTAGAALTYFTDNNLYIDAKDSTSNMIFRVGSDAERMRINSSGNVLVGTSSTFDNVSFLKVQSLGGVSTKIAGTGAASQMSFFNDNGRVGYIGTDGTTTTYYTSSDARLKHDIIDAPEASDLIDAIKVRSFKWNVDDSEQRYGLVAQELFEVAPEAVGGSPDSDEMMAVDYGKLVPMLVKEIQSLRARVAELEISASTITFEGN
jgi:hypothetical protein